MKTYVVTCPDCGFNPRPPFRAGATVRGWQERPGFPVSILARPFERALPSRAATSWRTLWFQSSPALSSGRYSVGVPLGLALWEFQSSPALSSGRYNEPESGLLIANVFQSSPALSSGRYAERLADVRRVQEFQSSPALSTGRYAQEVLVL